MAVGHVKWFSNTKGFGFIVPEGGGADLFAHYTAIQMDGYRGLQAGDRVSFDLQEGAKGGSAIHIRVLQAAEGKQSPQAADTSPVEMQAASAT
jgi:CspA family cold shock protein